MRVLRNLGLNAPGPVLWHYDWPGRGVPFAHQRDTTDFLTLNPRCFVLNDMGTGKTRSGLWALDYLSTLGQVRKTLIVAPLSTLERAWGDEIFRNFPGKTFCVLHGDKSKRLKLAKAEFDIYIINHDGVKCEATMGALKTRGDIDLALIDEIAAFRNPRTQRWKSLNNFINGNKKLGWTGVPWAWGFTGTPIPNEPTDAYGQVRLILPGKVPPYFGHFRDMVMKAAGPYKYVAREDALSIISTIMQPAIRYARDECIDLPPTTYSQRSVSLTPEQNAAYKAMLQQFKAEHDGQMITAVNEAAKLAKLLQIVWGVVYTPQGEVFLPNAPRIDLVREIVEASQAKVIVFVPLVAALKNLAEELAKDFTVAVVHGQTSKSERDEIFSAFQNAKDPHVLVASPGCMSHGLTLTAANTTVWYGPITSNEIWEQANARTPRPGQKLSTHIITIEGCAAERKAYDRLQKKQSTQGMLLELMEGE